MLKKLAEHVKAFQSMTTAEIAELFANAEKCTHAPGTTIVKKGSVGAYMYIIFEGEALQHGVGHYCGLGIARAGLETEGHHAQQADNPHMAFRHSSGV